MSLPIHPCGAITDVGRTCFRVQMRLYHGGPLVDVVYFPAPAGARPVPWPHRYGGHDFGPRAEWSGLGQQEPPLSPRGRRRTRWYSGRPPAPYRGDHVDGPEVAWREGAVIGRDPELQTNGIGQPPGCATPNVRADGGQKEGGRSLWPMTASGGQREGGHAPFPLTATGGQKEGGRSLWPMTASGGQREGGSARWGRPVFVGSWGQREGGSARWGRPLWVATGGQREGGWSRWGLPLWVGRGGQLEGGSARWGRPLWVSAGGQREGGFAAWAGPLWVGRGGQREGGLAAWAGAVWVAGGGQAEGGGASWAVPVWVADGGQAEGGEASFPGPDVDPDYFGCTHCPDGTYSVWNLTVAGGTGQFSAMNGTWPLTNTTLCTWRYEDGSYVINLSPSVMFSGFELTFNAGMAFATWSFDPFGCVGTNAGSLVSSGGTGTPPTSAQLDPGI